MGSTVETQQFNEKETESDATEIDKINENNNEIDLGKDNEIFEIVEETEEVIELDVDEDELEDETEASDEE